MSTVTGQVLGRYRLQASLGRGGMAEVYRAADEKLGRTVAVKVILPAFAQDPDFHRRFLREARLVAGLEHPNVLPVYDFGEQDGLPYLVMPYLEGGTLRERLRNHGVALDTVVDWVDQLAAALDAAHGAGILHRDVKPANVLVGRDERPILGDFGIAMMAEGSTRLTSAGIMVGTPLYMAPELAQGEPAVPASDLYALAAMAFHVLAGRPPFEGESSLALLHQHVTRPVPSLAEVRPGLPPALDAVFAQALAKDPQERPPSCRAFARSLRTLEPAATESLTGMTSMTGSGGDRTAATLLTRPDSTPRGRRRGARRPGRLWPRLAAALLAGAGVAGTFAWLAGQDGGETMAHQGPAPTTVLAPVSSPSPGTERLDPGLTQTEAHESSPRPDPDAEAGTAQSGTAQSGTAEPGSTGPGSAQPAVEPGTAEAGAAEETDPPRPEPPGASRWAAGRGAGETSPPQEPPNRVQTVRPVKTSSPPSPGTIPGPGPGTAAFKTERPLPRGDRPVPGDPDRFLPPAQPEANGPRPFNRPSPRSPDFKNRGHRPGGQPPGNGRRVLLDEPHFRLVSQIEDVWRRGRPQPVVYQELLDMVRGEQTRNPGHAVLELLGTFAEGGLAYLENDGDEARRKLNTLLLERTRGHEVLSVLPLGFLHHQGHFNDWQLALAYGDPKSEAEDLLLRDLRQEPSETTDHLGLAVLFHLDGKHLKAAREAARVYPDLDGRGEVQSDVAHWIGEEYAHAGRLDKAVDWYLKVKVSNPLQENGILRSLDLYGGPETVDMACTKGLLAACNRPRRPVFRDRHPPPHPRPRPPRR